MRPLMPCFFCFLCWILRFCEPIRKPSPSLYLFSLVSLESKVLGRFMDPGEPLCIFLLHLCAKNPPESGSNPLASQLPLYAPALFRGLRRPCLPQGSPLHFLQR